MGTRGVRKTKVTTSVSLPLILQPSDLLDFAIQTNSLTSLSNVDLKKIANEWNIRIKKVSLDEGVSGLLELDEEGGWNIKVNEKHSPNRQRFTIAHELAHFFLHRHQKGNFHDKDSVFFRSDHRDPMEYAANDFAAELLMPETAVTQYFWQGLDTYQLAKLFEVSPLALRIRLSKLGLESEDS